MAPTRIAPSPQSLLQALADDNRLRILEALRAGESCVCDLQAELDLGQSLLSHHLAVLREVGLVADRREGRWVHYSLVPEVLGEIERFVCSLRQAAERPSGRRGSCQTSATSHPGEP